MSFIKRGALGLRKRTDRRVTKPPESSPPLAARGVCHGIDTDKSAEIEHKWIHADADTQAEEAHTESHFQHRYKPNDLILYPRYAGVVKACVQRKKSLIKQLN